MPTHDQTTPLFSVLLACIGSILIGLSPLFVRSADLGPMTLGFYRMLFALPLLWVWMRRENPVPIFSKDYVALMLGGAFFAIDLAFWNASVNYTTIVNATLFNNTAAFFVPLLLWLIFSEKQPGRFLIAGIFGFVGCGLLVCESFTISAKYLIGDIMSLISGIMVALYIITIKKIRERLPTGMLMFWTGVASLVGMGAFGLLFGESFWPLTPDDWLSIFGQAILVHVMGQGLLAYAMGRVPASYGALIMLLAPATAAVFGWIIYAEALSLMKLAGMAIIMASIMFVRQTRPASVLAPAQNQSKA